MLYYHKNSFHITILAILTAAIIHTKVDAATSAYKYIRIVAKTKDGTPFKARLSKKKFPAEETEPFIVQSSTGVYTIVEDKCDDTIYYKIIPTSVFVVRAENSPEWLPCTEPEVVFEDFILAESISLDSESNYSSPKFWRSLIPWTDASADINMLPNELASAFREKEFGKIAIITSEISNELRSLGKHPEADFFYSLSVDATGVGIASKLEEKAPNAPVTVFVPAKDRIEFTPEGKALLEAYQIKTLGLSTDSNEFGKAGWQTMKSLPGGTGVVAENYKGIIENFSIENVVSDGSQAQPG